MRPSSPLSPGQRVQEEATPMRQLVGFRIGDEEFGVDILMVQEIIRLPAITPIPNAPRFILGMINLRGRVIPIIDLRQRLRINGKNPGEAARIDAHTDPRDGLSSDRVYRGFGFRGDEGARWPKSNRLRTCWP